MSSTFSTDRFTGVFTALVTPMRDGAVDFAALDLHLRAQISADVHGVVVLGTTGEAATLSDDEADAVLDHIVTTVANRCTVIAGTGSNSTATAIAKARRAAAAGVDGLLVVTPYYNKPSANGLYEHFAAIAAAVDLPVMLYNVPARSGVDLKPDVCARLSEAFGNIIGIKEASGHAERVTELRLACGADFIIHAGDDNLTLPFLALGADGVTSVASNLIPSEMVALFNAWARGDARFALQLHRAMFSLIATLFIESNPVPVKAALALRGAMAKDVRLPLFDMTDENRTVLRRRLEDFDRHASA